MRRLPIYVASLSTDIVGWLILLALRVVFGRAMTWRHGVLAVRLRAGCWFERRMRAKVKGWGATTVCAHGMVFADDAFDDAETWAHELVHCEQKEAEALQAAMLAGFAMAAKSPWWLVGAILCGPWTNYSAGMATAVLRGERPYRNNHLEEAAYDSVHRHRGGH